jgi:hypothetical protein
VAEGGSLLNCCTLSRCTEGSNPSVSADWLYIPLTLLKNQHKQLFQRQLVSAGVPGYTPPIGGIETGFLGATGIQHGGADTATVIGCSPERETGMAR